MVYLKRGDHEIAGDMHQIVTLRPGKHVQRPDCPASPEPLFGAF